MSILHYLIICNISYAVIYIIVRRLKKAGLYKKSYLYRVFDGKRLDEFLRQGTYRLNSNSIFAFDINEFAYRGNNGSLIEFLDNYYVPAIAIYDETKLEELNVSKYKFKDPDKKFDAVVGIVERIIFPSLQ